MSTLVKECSSAAIAMAQAFIGKDFLSFVAAYGSPLTAGVRSGVKEIKETIEELRSAGRNMIKVTGEAKRLYAPGVVENTEHVFSLELPVARSVKLEPREHSAQLWLPWREAADKCFSWSNRDAIRMLGEGRVPVS